MMRKNSLTPKPTHKNLGTIECQIPHSNIALKVSNALSYIATTKTFGRFYNLETLIEYTGYRNRVQ